MATDLQQNKQQNKEYSSQGRSQSGRSTQRAASSLVSASAQSKKNAAVGKEQIAKRAYEIWLSRGCENGHDLEHWVEAEKQLKQQASN